MIILAGCCQKSFMVGMMVLYLLSAGKGFGCTAALFLVSDSDSFFPVLYDHEACFSITATFVCRTGLSMRHWCVSAFHLAEFVGS